MVLLYYDNTLEKAGFILMFCLAGEGYDGLIQALKACALRDGAVTLHEISSVIFPAIWRD